MLERAKEFLRVAELALETRKFTLAEYTVTLIY
jgi:hypothetical protein